MDIEEIIKDLMGDRNKFIKDLSTTEGSDDKMIRWFDESEVKLRNALVSYGEKMKKEGEEKGWTKGWLNGVETGMNYFDETGVSGTKVPNTDLTIKQKIDLLRLSSQGRGE